MTIDNAIKKADFPVKAKRIAPFTQTDYFLEDDNNTFFIVKEVNEKEIVILNNLKKKNSNVLNNLFYYKNEKTYYIYNCSLEILNEEAVMVKLLDKYIELIEKTKIPITLTKEDTKKMQSIYQILDNKFSYFELRIKEIELKYPKEDADWIILSNYHILLNTKMWMYDLQQALFKMLEKNIILDYGLVFKNMNQLQYQNNKLLPTGKFYYAPVSTMLARYYTTFDHLNIDLKSIKNILNQQEKFYKVYYMFFVNYLYILNLNFPIIIDIKNINNFLTITKKLKYFYENFKDYVKL